MAYDIEQIRGDFPILEREVNRRKLVYFDSGATAQKPQRVIEVTDSLMRESNANIHRGVHHLSGVMTQMYEDARERVRKFIGAEHREEVIFTAGATASINLVAYCSLKIRLLICNKFVCILSINRINACHFLFLTNFL